MKALRIAKATILVIAMITSMWAAFACFVQLGDLGRMVFVDFNLPRRSFEAFLHEIPQSVMADIYIGHENGMRMLAIPLIATAILWLGIYVITELQRKRNR
jgi:hypothetical protein